MWDDARQLNAVALGLALVAFAALGAGLVAWLVRQPAFEFRDVVVTDTPVRASAAQLEAVIRDELAGTFLTMNLDRARDAIARMPWVRRVALRREWPRRLVVTIEEHEPRARWNADARLYGTPRRNSTWARVRRLRAFSTWAESSGSRTTSARNSLRRYRLSTASETARAVPLRGAHTSVTISPTKPPGPTRPSTAARSAIRRLTSISPETTR